MGAERQHVDEQHVKLRAGVTHSHVGRMLLDAFRDGSIKAWLFGFPVSDLERLEETMARRKKFIHGREVGLTIKTWSEDDTKFPDAWDETLELLKTHNRERIVGFKVELHFAPVERPAAK